MRGIFAVSLLILGLAGYSQTTVFSENFDQPSSADSIVSGTIGTSSAIPGDTTSSLFISANHSYQIKGTTHQTQVYFETNFFSTIGLPFVKLEFDQIGKLYQANYGKIEVSTDSGSTWILLNQQHYRGKDNNFSQNSGFNEASYDYSWNDGLWEPANSTAYPTQDWWVHEQFDLTGIASDTSVPGNWLGFPAVKVRFRAEFNTSISGNGSFASGWYVDNLKVTAAICEINPPSFNHNFTTVPCHINNPKGIIPTLPNQSYPVTALVHDTMNYDSGVDSVVCYYRINGGNWISNRMIPQPWNLAQYRTTIQWVAPGVTADYYLVAWDSSACSNATRSPDRGFFSFTPSEYDPKCNTHSCSSVKVISSFPWHEDFEGYDWVAGTGIGNSGSSHRGNISNGWTVSPNKALDYGWSVRSGPTGTARTGPHYDHTSTNGNYLYTEFSPTLPSGIVNTVLTTPCIDLTDNISKVLSFYYHMLGENSKQLKVFIDTGSSSVAYWTNYQIIHGPQQNYSTDPWKKAYVDLEPFKGKVIKVAFVVRAIKSSDMQDIAIDDISIIEPPSTDAEIAELVTPNDGSCVNDSNPVEIRVRNVGVNDLTSIPIAYQLDNLSIYRDTIRGQSVGTTDTLGFIFSDSLLITPGIPHVLKVWVELPGDLNSLNDTLVQNILINGNGISQLPYYLDFESSSVIPGSAGLLNDDSWNMNVVSIGGRFELFDEQLDNSLQGPFEALGLSRRALRVLDYDTGPTSVNLKSNCIDLTNNTSPNLCFSHYISTNRKLYVRVKEIGSPWSDLAIITGAAGLKEGLTFERISLAAYGGKEIQLEFIVEENDAINLTNQVVIDNIQIAESTQIELGIQNEIGDLRRISAGSTSLPAFDLHFVKSMSGTAPNTTIHVSFSSTCDSSLPAITGDTTYTPYFPFNGPVSIRQIPSFQLSDTLRAGLYTLKVWIHTTNDSLHYNDTVFQECIVQSTIEAPYFNDFESCNQDFLSNGEMRQWQMGQPSGGALSGNFAFVTNLDTGLISGNNLEKLVPPFFIGLDTLNGCELRFSHKYNFQGPVDENYGSIQYLDQGVWKSIPSLTNPGNGMSYSGIHGYVFHGSTSNQWKPFSISLHEVTHPGLNVFRFATKSTDTSQSNWEVDDFEIYVPPQVSASPNALVFSQGLPKAGTHIASVEILNSGAKDLTNVVISILDQSGNLLLLDSVDLINPLPILSSGTTKTVQLSKAISLNNGSNHFTIVTSWPNNRYDELPQDDTNRVTVKVLPTIDSMSYCVDFESSSEFFSFSRGTPDDFWAWGKPSKVVFNTAYSGNNAWITEPMGQYGALSDNYLYTPSFEIEGQKCYQLSFWHWFETEMSFDGGNVEFSLDNGMSWTVLGSDQDSGWYNTPYIQALSAIYPGFSGSSGAWTNASKKFKVFSDGTIQFRFRFASTTTIHNEGWMIDDLCFEQIPGWCYEVDNPEYVMNNRTLNVYPNPFSNNLTFSFSEELTQGGHLTVKIFNLVGELLLEETLMSSERNLYTIDVSDLPKGSYMLMVDPGKSYYHQTILKQ